MEQLAGANILVVIAHPDDETLGCGGTLSHAARAGATCRVLLPVRRGDPRGVEHWPGILENFSSACGTLGAEAVVPSNPVVDLWADNQVEEIRAVVDPLIDWADLILTHFPGDVHQAHRAVSRAVEIATRPFRRRRSVAFFEVASSTDQAYVQAFSPNLFILLDEEDARRKCEAMAVYRTELAPGRTSGDVRMRLAHRGVQVGATCAEAFHIARWFL